MWSAHRGWAVGLALAAVSAFGLTGEFARASAATPGYGAFVARIGGRVSTFSTSTNMQSRSILAGGFAQEIAMAPDGKTAYVTGGVGLVLINTATDTVEHTIAVKSPYGVAITPDGETAYVTNFSNASVTPVNLVTDKAETPITVGSDPIAVAVAPNGKTAYVADDGSVTPINTATDTADPPITVGSFPAAIAIAPNGETAYVASQQFPVGTVTPINLATNTAGTPISIGRNPADIAITPDGKTAYVTWGTDSVTPINTATNTAGTPITVAGTPYGIAITPDGKTAYVTDRGVSAVTPIDIATNTPGRAFTVGSGPVAIAITPGPLPLAPKLTKLKQSHASWRTSTGTTFSFSLSERARVSLAFSRHGHLRATVVVNGHAGKDKLAFAGRLSRSRKLTPGRYTVVVTATNPAGQTSVPQKLTFTIVK
jgi:YVTN family beta-propeller protein